MKVTVKVPATSANLGPGFDVAGIALSLYNTFTFEEIDKELIYEGCHPDFANKDNMVYRSFMAAAQEIGLFVKGLKITFENQVPYTRGLGSSSTCIVAGIAAAYAFKGLNEDRQAVLNLATQIEGHPDNVAPAIFGGVTVSAMLDNVVTLDIPVKNRYTFMALIPNFTLSTEESRSVLPKKIKREDAIFNVSHLALLMGALINGKDEYLKDAFKDRLHQPYRGDLILNYPEIMALLENENDVLGAYLSGAGPTIMTVLKENADIEALKNKLSTLIEGWDVIILSEDEKGYECIIEE